MHLADAKYQRTRARVETYFDKTATKSWERLTSDAPVSGIRATVRAGRDEMRGLILDQMPADLTGCRVLDAGCGTGALAQELAKRGAEVLAIDISPSLIEIAETRTPRHLKRLISYRSGDMTDAALGAFDYVCAMDSMIYYNDVLIGSILAQLCSQVSGKIIFTLPPKTPLLMAMWRVGKLFPLADRSPSMVPHSAKSIAMAAKTARANGSLQEITTVKSGFYFSTLLTFTTGGQG